MRRHDQTVDLLVAVVGQRENRPVVSGLSCPYLDAADDAIGTRRGGNLHAIAVGMLEFNRRSEVDRAGVDPHVDRLDGRGAGEPAKNPKRQRGEHRKGAMEYQKRDSDIRPLAQSEPRRSGNDPVHTLSGFIWLCAEFSARRGGAGQTENRPPSMISPPTRREARILPFIFNV